jgi:hypothetical protein
MRIFLQKTINKIRDYIESFYCIKVEEVYDNDTQEIENNVG